jgi:hypothetical protein
MALAAKFYFAGSVLARSRAAVLEQEAGMAWAQAELRGRGDV